MGTYADCNSREKERMSNSIKRGNLRVRRNRAKRGAWKELRGNKNLLCKDFILESATRKLNFHQIYHMISVA